MAVIIQFEGCARVTDADKIESAGNIPFPACGQVGSGGFDHAAAFGGRHARLGRSKAPLAAQTDFDKNQFVPVPADKIQFIRTAAPIAGEYPHPGLFQPIRGGILSVDPGQTEGAKAIGMSHVQTMVNVILPQALRNIMPQIGNNFIINVKDSSVMFIISFTEFFAVHRAAVGQTYLYFPSATIEMIGYLTMTLIASFLLRLLEKKLDGNDSYDLVQVDALTMSAGTYNYPGRGTPFDERNPEAQKSMLREELRRQAERDAAVREGQKAEPRRAHGNETRNQDGGDQ